MEVDREKFKEYAKWLMEKLNTVASREIPIADGEVDRYYNRFMKLVEIMYSKDIDTIEEHKRDRWNFNENRIKNYIHNTLVNKRYVPSNKDISEATGLSRVTITKHIKENNLSSYKADERDKYRMLNSSALNQLYYLAFKNGDVKALKMFIELTKEPEDSSKVVNNNYIQINNTKIDSLLVDQLPIKTRLQIENLILKNIPKSNDKI